MIAATFYCDESGNSGPNYVDGAQPFFTVGGFLIPDAKLLDAAVVLEGARERLLPQARELKASAVLRRHSGVGIIGDIVSQLVALPAMPLFVIAEKRFCVAAKIVETFLDPAYNDRITNFFASDRTLKGQLANDLLRLLSSEALDLFAAAYRTPTERALGEALLLLCGEAKSRLSPEVATLLSGATPHLPGIARSEGWYSGHLNGINLPAVLSLFQLVEHLARALDITVSKFVHDEIATYEDVYRETFLTFRGAGNEVIRYPTGHPGLTGLASIERFETQASHTSPFVQGADLLVGAITRIARNVLNGLTLTTEERELGTRMFAPALLGSEPVTAWSISSEEFSARLVAALELGEFSPSSPLSRDPLLPLVGSNRGSRDDSAPRVAFPCPMWVITDGAGSFLKVYQLSHGETAPGEGPVAIPIFSSHRLASGFLATNYPSDNVLRVEIHCDSMERTLLAVNTFRNERGVAEYVTIDPNEREPWACVSLESVISQFDAVLVRSRRAAMTGIASTLVQHHVVGGRSFTTYLLANGLYAGEEDSRRVVVTAETREDALALAVESSE